MNFELVVRLVIYKLTPVASDIMAVNSPCRRAALSDNLRS